MIVGRRAAVLAALLLLALAIPGPAWAEAPQGALISSSPADDAVLATPPAEVKLTFSAAVSASSSHAALSTAAGNSATAGSLRQGGPDTVRLPVTIAAAGDYLAAYHVVFADGTFLVGAVRFSVGTGRPPAVSDATRLGAQRAVSTHQHEIDPFNAVLLAVDGFALFAAILLLILRPNPHRAGAAQRESWRR